MDPKRLNPLSESDIDALHEAAVEVLRDPGARITTEAARELLLANGATQIGEDTISIPADLVDQALSTAPKTFWMYDRNGEPKLELGAGNVYAGAGVTNLNYLDPRTLKVEEFTLGFTAESALLADALPNIDFVATPGVTRPGPELPLHVVNQEEFLAMVTNTTKPLMVLIADEPELRDIYDMAELVAGGREELRAKPFVVPYLNSVSPLLFNPETLDKLFLSAERGLPVACQAAPQVGATGPVTIAGTVVISAAETLIGLVLSQLKNPGTPFISGTVPFLMDMRFGTVTAGGPDGVRFMITMGQLCRRWGLPMVGMSYGGDSKDADEQGAMEAVYYGFGTVLGGVDLVFDAGCVEGGLLFSPELLVISDEAAGMTRRAVEPIEVNEETIGLDVIRAVGPGNVFLGEDHTLAHFRELWNPQVLSWEGRREWEMAGAKTLRERAREKVFEIWETHKVDPLPDEVLAGMRGIIERRRENPETR
jgi:trimethylamine--corrinoid protein Co-methyltransferase